MVYNVYGDNMKFLEKHGIRLEDDTNLKCALTHPSYSNEHGGGNYERLEFLGDAVLELAISDYFFNDKNYSEGEMTKLRSSYVCESANYEYAKSIGLIPYIRVGKGQINNVNETIVADIYEAVLGAIFLDKGYEVTKDFILDTIVPYIKSNHSFHHDYKSLFQELIQTGKKSLEYVEVSVSGPAHDRIFTFEVKVDGIVYGRGTGKSKKEAEQNAAKDAYMKAANKKE